jgi:SAM-dependent methyltransferase
MSNYSRLRKEYLAEREAHWDNLAASFNHDGLRAGYHQRLSLLYQQIIPEGQSILEIGCAKGELLAALKPSQGVGVDHSKRMLDQARNLYPSLEFVCAEAHNLEGVRGPFDYIIFSDLIDDLWDVQEFLEQVRKLCAPSTRIVFNMYSHLWSLPLQLAQKLGHATPMLPQNWMTVEDLQGLFRLTGLATISHRTEILFPLSLPVISACCNQYLAKIKPFSYLDLTHLIVATPVPKVMASEQLPFVSVIVPARNEAGNIVDIMERVPQMGAGTEIIFVEGGSTDGTFAVIESEIARHPERNSHLLKQNGSGKGDAVRMGFEHASGDILMILDADLTVAPEDLPKFYNALVQECGEFINGVRLVYPMNGKAMRLFNLIGNKFFSLTLTWLLGQSIKDTLCGTKAFWRSSYQKIAAQRGHFGGHDPFGDFDLLFAATRLNLKIIDLPVRYGERTYGDTNIKRWTHGLLLLKMLLLAARKIKFI